MPVPFGLPEAPLRSHSDLLRRAVSILNLVHWIGIAALSLSLSGCVDLCENEIKTEVASPDETKRAVIFERSCGATTPFSTHVSVLNRGEACHVRQGMCLSPMMLTVPLRPWM